MTSGKTHLMVALLLTAAVFSPRSAHADDTLTALKNAVEALQGQMQKMQESYESQIASLKSRIDILEKEKTAPTQANASPQTVTPPSGLLPLRSRNSMTWLSPIMIRTRRAVRPHARDTAFTRSEPALA